MKRRTWKCTAIASLALAVFFLGHEASATVLTQSAGGAAPRNGQPAASVEEAPVESTGPNSPWVSMPAGARKTYIGIHGGTVPVSLLTAGDGSPMIAQVGLTGSDFLHFLRTGGKAETDTLFQDITPFTEVSAPPASDQAGTLAAESGAASGLPEVPTLPDKNATVLFAGTAAGDVPVIYATGRSFENMSLVLGKWAPFGLTEKALSFEGTVKVTLPPKKKPGRAARRS